MEQSVLNQQRSPARLKTAAIFLALMTSSLLAALATLAPAAVAAPSLYVANSTARTVSAFTIGPGGAPSPVAGSPFSVGIAPVGVAVTPGAEHLYVTNLESNTISAFTIEPDGGLIPVPGSPFATEAGPWGVAVSPDGEHLYVANSNADRVSAYAIACDGSLSPVPGSPFPTGAAPGRKANGVAVTPDGGHLYVTNMNGGGSVAAFSITCDGSLSPVLGSPFDAGSDGATGLRYPRRRSPVRRHVRQQHLGLHHRR